MVRHVYERARKAKTVDDVVVATDDERVLAAVSAFGGRAVMTSPACPTGTDRLAEAASQVQADIYVNVQGDEPMIDPGQIDVAVNGLRADPEAAISTLSLPLRKIEEMMSDAVVKVVTDVRGHALYFSRSPIPHARTPEHRLEAAVRSARDLSAAGVIAHVMEGLRAFTETPSMRPTRNTRGSSLDASCPIRYQFPRWNSSPYGRTSRSVDSPR